MKEDSLKEIAYNPQHVQMSVVRSNVERSENYLCLYGISRQLQKSAKSLFKHLGLFSLIFVLLK